MRHFDQQLQELMRTIVLMGSTVQTMIGQATRCLMERASGPADDVFAREQEVNRLQMQADEMAVTLAALHQPMAADVRFLFMASRIVSELERMGDQAVNICQNAQRLVEEPPMRPLVDIPIMAEVALRMVRDALNSLVHRDVDTAQRVLRDEQQVDAFKDQIFRTLLTYMMADPGTINRALSLILVSRNLERIGDHATNIAEEVIYMVQGRDIRHKQNVPPAPSPAVSSGRPDARTAGEGAGGTDNGGREFHG